MSTKNERLAQARARAGYDSAADAIDAFGWRGSTYYGHENGSRGLSSKAIERYAKAFRVSPEWLAFGRGEQRVEVALSQDDERVTAEGIEAAVEMLFDRYRPNEIGAMSPANMSRIIYAAAAMADGGSSKEAIGNVIHLFAKGAA